MVREPHEPPRSRSPKKTHRPDITRTRALQPEPGYINIDESTAAKTHLDTRNDKYSGKIDQKSNLYLKSFFFSTPDCNTRYFPQAYARRHNRHTLTLITRGGHTVGIVFRTHDGRKNRVFLYVYSHSLVLITMICSPVILTQLMTGTPGKTDSGYSAMVDHNQLTPW